MESFETSEFIGALLGDGNIWAKKYELVITGDRIKDKDYFEYLSRLVEANFDYKPHIRFRSGGLRLVIRSKSIFSSIKRHLPNGKRALSVEIPAGLDEKAVLRGIFDTDGSIFFSRKPGVDKYPCIEISTISCKLAEQLVELLSELGFRPRIRTDLRIHRVYIIALNGKNQARKWLADIGSSNPTKLARLAYAVRLLDSPRNSL